jgi:hypothetical protein
MAKTTCFSKTLTTAGAVIPRQDVFVGCRDSGLQAGIDCQTIIAQPQAGAAGAMDGKPNWVFSGNIRIRIDAGV